MKWPVSALFRTGALLGLLPAIAILILLRLHEGHLSVLGQEVAEYSGARLFAALLSLATPILLLFPAALASDARPRRARHWALAAGHPWLLLFPAVLAIGLVGGRDWGACLAALALLSLLAIALVLWLEVLRALAGTRTALLLYGAVWAVSAYVEHLRLYVLPYLDLPALRAVNLFYWLLPQVQGGLSHVDDFLQTGHLETAALAPTLIHLPVLAVLVWWLGRRAGRGSEPSAAGGE